MKRSNDGSAARTVKLAVVALALAGFAAFAWPKSQTPAVANSLDAKQAKAAFLEASKVFLSHRCMNCHTAGDVPTQGDSATPHPEGVGRGKEGRGLEGLACTDCHMAQNTEGEGMPPGVPDWRMPPADMKMVFQGRTPAELCRQIKDPKLNGGKTKLADVIHHMEGDPLVLWAWAPGNNRTVPPMTHKDFMAKMKTWVDNGGACPDQ